MNMFRAHSKCYTSVALAEILVCSFELEHTVLLYLDANYSLIHYASISLETKPCHVYDMRLYTKKKIAESCVTFFFTFQKSEFVLNSQISLWSSVIPNNSQQFFLHVCTWCGIFVVPPSDIALIFERADACEMLRPSMVAQLNRETQHNSLSFDAPQTSRPCAWDGSTVEKMRQSVPSNSSFWLDATDPSCSRLAAVPRHKWRVNTHAAPPIPSKQAFIL